MKRPLLFSGLIYLLVFLSACSVAEDKTVAETVAKDFFQTVMAKDFDKAIGFYGAEFFAKTSKEEWLQSIKSINSKLGDLEKYELVSWKVTARTGTGLSGTFFTLQYKTTYAKFPADETLTLFKSSAGGDIKIVGHNINSMGLLK